VRRDFWRSLSISSCGRRIVTVLLIWRNCNTLAHAPVVNHHSVKKHPLPY
jgi:hypothetical protein